MSAPREFASDNTAPVHPAVLDALVAEGQYEQAQLFDYVMGVGYH